MTGNHIVVIGITIMVVGTVGIVCLTVLFLPWAGALGSASPACFFGTCMPSDLYKVLTAAFAFLTLGGIGLFLFGRRLCEVEGHIQAGESKQKYF